MITLNNDYFIGPLQGISRIMLWKNVSNDYFNEIFKVFFESLKDHKKNRTLRDVEEAFKKVEKELSLDRFDRMNDKEYRGEMRIIRESAIHFIEENARKIEVTFHETKARNFLLRWIFTYDEAINIFLQFFRKLGTIRYLIRRPKDLVDSFYYLFEGLFLVLYRIFEQIYILSNDLPFNENEENEFLIGDVVYYGNLQRSLLHEAFRGK